MLTVHPWIGSNPIELVDQLKKTAFNWNLASTIATVAMGAITFATVGASFIVTVPASITVLGIVIPSLLSFATSYFRDHAIALEQVIAKEEPVAEALKKILAWNEADIVSFFDQHKIKKSVEIPLRNFLPLIARYQARCKQADFFSKKSYQLLLSKDVSERGIRLWQRLEGWKYLEEIVLPARIEAAFVLEVLHHPATTGTISSQFSLIQKTYAERILDKTWDKEDDYLQFHLQNREPITFDTLSKISDPQCVHKLLYG